jgi:hypothetical protein
LLSVRGELIQVNAFFLVAIIIIALAMPRVGGNEHLWLNGVYDSAVVILFFPLIIFLAASGD